MSSSDPSGTRRLPALLSTLILLAGAAAACARTVAVPAHPPAAPAPRVALADVLAAVRAAASVRVPPAGLTPSAATAGVDVGFDSDRCEAGPAADRVDACVFG